MTAVTENVDGELAAAIHALEQAVGKLHFVGIASQIEGIESLDPEQFMGEILEDIHQAAESISKVREGFLARRP